MDKANQGGAKMRFVKNIETSQTSRSMPGFKKGISPSLMAAQNKTLKDRALETGLQFENAAPIAPSSTAFSGGAEKMAASGGSRTADSLLPSEQNNENDPPTHMPRTSTSAGGSNGEGNAAAPDIKKGVVAERAELLKEVIKIKEGQRFWVNEDLEQGEF